MKALNEAALEQSVEDDTESYYKWLNEQIGHQ